MESKAHVFTLLALVILVFALGGCTTDALQMGPNGDARLRYLEIKGVDLIPPFDPKVQQYFAVLPDPARAEILVAPFIYFTTYTINGQYVLMNTNVYGLPTYTPYSLAGSSNMRIVTRAEDGLSRTYTVSFIDKELVDAGLTGISTPTGILAPWFSEGRAPYYISYNGLTVTNTYTLVITNTSYTLQMTKSASNANLTVNGTSVAAGVYAGSAPLVHPGSGTQIVKVTNISPNGMFTNVKQINVTIAYPSNDARAQSIKFYNPSTGGEITYIKSFSPDRMAYSLVLDNLSTVRVVATPVQSGATVTVIRDTLDAGGNYTIQNTYTGVQLENIPCEMGDKLTVRITQGITQKNYVWDLTLYTSSQGYGFDGGIGDFLRFIHQAKEWGSTTQPRTVTGIVTFNVSADDGFFIEDGEYGLYVWAGFWDKPPGLRVGQKVTITFKYAKLWMGLAEIAYLGTYNTNPPGSLIVQTMVDYKPRPIFYQTTKQWYSVADPNLQIYRHAARMVRYVTDSPIYSPFNSSDIGEFTQGYSFKLATDYNNEEYTRTYSPAVSYMQEGKEGTFFGPLLYDGTMYLFTAHASGMIIPWDVRAPE